MNSPQSSEASLNANEIVFYINKNKVLPNDSISFFLGLRSGGSWQAGSITLRDLFTNSEKTYNINAEFTLIADFLLDLPPGGFDNETHTIEATDGILVESLEIWVYNHEEQCNGDTNNCNLEIDQVIIDNLSPSVGGSFNVSIKYSDLSNILGVFPDVASWYVKTNGFINSPILSSSFYPGETCTGLECYDLRFFPDWINFTILIPGFHPLGSYNFEIGYSGDETYWPVSTSETLFISDDDFVLDIFPESVEIDRSSLTETNQLPITLRLGGAEYSLDNVYYNVSLVTTSGTSSLTTTPVVIGNRDRQVIVDVPSQIPLGDAIIKVDILDGANTVLFSNQTAILIYDTVDMLLSPSNPHVRAGETINFLALTALTDRPNTPIETSIVVKNTTHLLGAGITTNSEWTFDYTVPSYLTQGSYTMIWELTPIGENNTLIRNNTIVKQYTVSLPTEFHVTNFPSQIFRNQNLDFDIQLLSLSFPLTGDVGSYDLIQKSDLSLIGSYQANLTNNMHLYISNDIPKGNYDLQLDYTGNGIYEPTSKDLTVKVLSRPFFDNVLTNASGGVVGEIIRISGYLLEENTGNNPVINADISIIVSDGSTQWIDGTIQTDSNGVFIYELEITASLSIGINFVRLTYAGDPANYYGSSSNEPIVNFDKDNILSLDLSQTILAGREFNYSVSGKLNGKYQLQYLDSLDQLWIPIINVTLDNQGYSEGSVLSPYIKGIIFFRIFDLTDNNSFLIQERDVYKVPDIQMTLEGKIFTKQETIFYFYANENFAVFLNDVRLTPTAQTWFQEEYYAYTFQFPGEYTLKIELTGEYLSFNNLTYEFTVYEDYEIIKSAPNIITEGSSVSVNIQISGKSIGFIQSVLVQIVNIKTELILAEGLTQNNGNISLTAIIFGDESEIFIKVPKQDIGKYKIEEQLIQLTSNIKRKLDITFDQEYQLSVNEKNSISLRAVYSATNNPASDVPFRIEIFKIDELISEFTITSNIEGRIDIPLGTLREGEYQIYIGPASDDYAPFRIATSVLISSDNILEDVGSISVVIIGAIALVGLGVVTRLRT
ncbi:MAG: hypothetical protein HeimC3_13900 [Candidatus Heimdallarchaeota archaeon LC_3]|nr:MAG: hypothetical protein HeimC3_13900 [Candidatus Heimdallarchaeota archaeon LC_3]